MSDIDMHENLFFVKNNRIWEEWYMNTWGYMRLQQWNRWSNKKKSVENDFKRTLYPFSFCDATPLFAFDSIGFAAYLAANCQINKGILKRTLLSIWLRLSIRPRVKTEAKRT